MKLRCPNCGHNAPLLNFANEESARQAVYLVADVPKSLGRLMLQYIGLFRPSTRSLSWNRSLKLMQQLKVDIDRGKIERHGRLWPAPESAWHSAFSTVLDSAQAGKLTLPLVKHGYLYQIISSEQNSAETVVENKKEQQRQQLHHRPKTIVPPELTQADKQAGEHSMTKILKQLKIKKKPKKGATK